MNGIWTLRKGTFPSPSSYSLVNHSFSRTLLLYRGVIKVFNASTFGAPSSQRQSQTTANAASANATAGPSSSFGGLGSTFAHFRSQVSLPPLASPQPDQLENASGGRGVRPAVASGGALATSSSNASATSSSDGGPGPSRGGITTTRDSLYGMADKLSAWPSEKVGKVKHLKDQFLSKV
jgi:hypothetical protein